MCLTETEIGQNQPVKTAKGHMGRLRNTKRKHTIPETDYAGIMADPSAILTSDERSQFN